MNTNQTPIQIFQYLYIIANKRITYWFLFYFVLNVLIILFFHYHQVLVEKTVFFATWTTNLDVQFNVVKLPDPSSFVTLDRVEVMYLSIFFLSPLCSIIYCISDMQSVFTYYVLQSLKEFVLCLLIFHFYYILI